MTKFSIFFTEPSKADFREIYDYGSHHWGKPKARLFLSEMKEHIDILLEQPYIGVERSRLQTGMRCLPFKSYLIYYFIKKETIAIARVLHMRQDVMSNFLSDQSL
ncbi:type II toxin-antitoxin system RelE/ParE family toxin [Parashewanella curva]|uniref:Toxin n=1 Tax=Parashewanella curva TaxID=2338552 RepID=A0A3L8Q3A1_9GAMM|nr:type II toxin-antitoxin system RelE/ParE family toxin [Parashewanella curva]RLV61112.1 type II toxin-antitoxin system RelE/ParE family toxin [Parashewanella curva]